MPKDIKEIRQEINQIDEQLVSLIEARLILANDVATYKKAHNLPVFDETREQEVLDKNVALLADPERYGAGLREIIQKIMDVSKDIQSDLLAE